MVMSFLVEQKVVRLDRGFWGLLVFTTKRKLKIFSLPLDKVPLWIPFQHFNRSYVVLQVRVFSPCMPNSRPCQVNWYSLLSNGGMQASPWWQGISARGRNNSTCIRNMVLNITSILGSCLAVLLHPGFECCLSYQQVWLYIKLNCTNNLFPSVWVNACVHSVCSGYMRCTVQSINDKNIYIITSLACCRVSRPVQHICENSLATHLVLHLPTQYVIWMCCAVNTSVFWKATEACTDLV